MDGSQIGELEYENFNAAGARIVCRGKSVHPGYAKGKMINSMLVANEFINALPEGEIPQETSGYEGFFHVTGISGSIEETVIEMIIRDHSPKKFRQRKARIAKIAGKINRRFAKQFGGDIVTAEVKDQYYNMKDKVEPVFHIVEIAEQAMLDCGVKPIIKPIRGGTDGCQLSYKGLPCPNIFAGGHNFHGKYEYVPVESMQKAMEVIVRIAEITAEGNFSKASGK
jgi:tripeptide aminopeptidase